MGEQLLRWPQEWLNRLLPPDQPPPRLRRSAEALRAKAEGGSQENREGARLPQRSWISVHVAAKSSSGPTPRSPIPDLRLDPFGNDHHRVGRRLAERLRIGVLGR